MKSEHKIIVLAIMFGLFAWIVVAVLDYLIFYEDSFLDLLILDVSSHDVYIRLFIFVTIVIFGLIISGIVAKREQAVEAAHKQLEVAHDQSIIYAEQLNKEIADRKMVQEELQKAYDQTEERIKWRVAELSEANALLEKEITERKQAEEALRESEERFRGISASAQDAVVMIDNKGGISYWNPAAEKMFGYTVSETVGKKLHTLIMPERYHEPYLKGFSTFKETGKGAAVGKILELESIRKDGTEFPIELSVSAVHIKGKWHAVGIMRDITKRRQREDELKTTHDQLEETNKKSQFAYAQMRDSKDRLSTQLHGEEIGFLIDENAQILGVTEKAMESTGQSRIELIGSNIEGLLHKDSIGELKYNLKRAWGGVFCKIPLKIVKEGSDCQEFETKFIRINARHERMLLVLMRESDGVDETDDAD